MPIFDGHLPLFLPVNPILAKEVSVPQIHVPPLPVCPAERRHPVIAEKKPHARKKTADVLGVSPWASSPATLHSGRHLGKTQWHGTLSRAEVAREALVDTCFQKTAAGHIPVLCTVSPSPLRAREACAACSKSGAPPGTTRTHGFRRFQAFPGRDKARGMCGAKKNCSGNKTYAGLWVGWVLRTDLSPNDGCVLQPSCKHFLLLTSTWCSILCRLQNLPSPVGPPASPKKAMRRHVPSQWAQNRDLRSTAASPRCSPHAIGRPAWQ